MSQCADIYLLQRQTLHVLGVTAPILRSSKNCICYLWYRSWYRYRYFLPPWPDPDQATVEGSSGTSTMTYTRGSRYSFWNS
jgi:hypothetical protein